MASLISAGTERMVLDFANKNLLDKARSRPDLVRQVVDKAQREGIFPTIEAVRARLDQPLSLGYSSAGIVLAVGDDVSSIRVGDLVACAGGGYATHAEVVAIPRHLVVRCPAPASDRVAAPPSAPLTAEEAAFTTLGAIALQGTRLADVKLGEVVAVIGLGLLGQLTVQLLKAAGCIVAGIDLQAARAELARHLGADAAVTDTDALAAEVARLSAGHGADAVLITADTPSNEPVELAGQIARDRAVIVAVGAVGLSIPRKPYYQKELVFRVSRSYGPGRYDPDYEEKGHDYPIGYVRWTENRNMQAFVRLLASGQVRVRPLITHRFPIAEAARAYNLITGKTGEPFLGVLIVYPDDTPLRYRLDLPPQNPEPATAGTHTAPATIRVGLLGAGNFAQTTLLPVLARLPGVELVGVSTASSLSARHTADRYGFTFCTTDEQEILRDPRINLVVVATRHNLHAQQAISALQAGKDVFVEKPLALHRDELAAVIRAQQQTGRRLMVGFNRRFAPMVRETRRFLAHHRRPLIAIYRVNAGPIPRTHWTQDSAVGGGRIIGEACHFIDLLQFLIGALPIEVSTMPIETPAGVVDDEVIITLAFADGSVGTVVYAAGGDKAYSKERLEIIGDGRIVTLDDFRLLELVHNGRRQTRRERLRPDKGHRAEWEALSRALLQGTRTPISPLEIVATHLATFAALDSLHERRPISVDTGLFWQHIAST